MQFLNDIYAMQRILPCLFIMLSFITSAQAQSFSKGDAENGAKIYLKCRSCHVLESRTNKMGPHLLEILGRKAGTVEDFEYSDAMLEARDNGLTWDESNLKKYLTSPKTMIPATSMRFFGLWESQIDDLLAYLKTSNSAEIMMKNDNP